MPRHSCDAAIRRNAWAMSGHRQSGDRWTCICGRVYEHVEDEAEGGFWMWLAKDETALAVIAPTNLPENTANETQPKEKRK